jgi:hypothetical protein
MTAHQGPRDDGGSLYTRRVLHELWEDPEGNPYLFCLAGRHGEQARAGLSTAARLTWTVEASSNFEAMTLYYEHQGWGIYTTSYPDWDKKTYAEHSWEP